MPKFRVHMEFTIDTGDDLVDDKRPWTEKDVEGVFHDALNDGDVWDNPLPTTCIVEVNELH